mmetsp:Transcript_38576/g.85866  ORF Transcript_38576/g.85866 Transcript_38576/m.85866 type:complete len:242 (-) Transcript_38576:623-1348(-)|eukprot:CAMPEP_0202916556 /NCGR_PEP_ID=MMETSP1392-20130828/68840_1 /ASSEMBLY_ACC=CAM_ASM_000868 /TAXON_ID=225041 /ORGANISM="Chlamydomonas chlamydogama, Strain SAG 11-48b" /LENGTH=241 /DNA_ID=CAMNT_0049609037 /DNA_START=92 /DNA_END=817 /DNA_ORIENTATION=+
MGIKLTEVSFETDVNERWASKGGIKVAAGDTKFKLKSTLRGKKAALELSADKWGVQYNLASKDVKLHWKTNIKPGELKISQRVPQSKWELVPTPEFQLTTTAINRGKFKDELELSHDMLYGVSKIEETLEYNGKYKLKVEADTATKLRGAHVGVRAKLRRPWCEQVGVDYSRMEGPVLTYDVEPCAQVEIESAISLRSRELWTALELKPTRGSRVTLTTDAVFRASRILKPALRLGAKVDL